MYDIAMIGSGIASAMSLCSIVESLLRMPLRTQRVCICVIEREPEMWRGVPYGQRSTICALAFQKLDEFLEEPERSNYIRWLEANRASWMETLQARGGSAAAQWMEDNARLMHGGRWGELYLPRFLFGMYIAGKAARAAQDLVDSGRGSVALVHGEATDCCRAPAGYLRITVEKPGGIRSIVQAGRVVMAIGSPPQQTVCSAASLMEHGHTHISNLYDPSEDVSMDVMQRAVSRSRNRQKENLLIMGSNASALEVLYLIHHRPDIKRHIGSIVVLSRSGLLPYRIGEQKISFELTALQALAATERFSAAALLAAITSDVRRAQELSLNIADLRDPVNATVAELTKRLTLEEQKRFVCEHGVHYSRMMRRAGRDTRDAAEALEREGMLSIVRGEFRRMDPSPDADGSMLATYAVAGQKDEVIHPLPFHISVNCAGFEELEPCSSRLINSVMESGLCSANTTRRGFLVNADLQASEDVYVIGPLVAGNFNDRVRLWHVESALRIHALSQLLANAIVPSLYSRDPHMFAAPLWEHAPAVGAVAPSMGITVETPAA